MFSRIRRQFGTAGLIVALVALVAALGGGAWAASGGLTTKEKGQVKAIAKKFAGKNGKNGAAGAPGAPGAVGSQGPQGVQGPKGDDGEDGEDGTDGKNVQLGTPTVGECAAGGTTVQVEGTPASKKAVCNGEPWTAGGTLPTGRTETGTYLASQESGGHFLEELALAEISFPIPLSAPITQEAKVIFNTTALDANCENSAHTGTASVQNPEAKPGFLCIYQLDSENLTFEAAGGPSDPVGVSGTWLSFTVDGEPGYSRGTWAVTAP